MPLSSFISDLYSSLSITEVQAEAPAAEEKEPQAQEQEEPKEEKEEAEEPEKEEEAAAEEEEEEEPEDPAPAITEECASSKECRPYKHHYDECVERVTTAASENASGPKEDCVEEFFHVLHCATTCAAPKIFAKLK